MEPESLGAEGLGSYLLLLTKISVPLLQSTTALGAARGWQGITTSPPRAAGIRRLTGFSLKSGASAGRKGRTPQSPGESKQCPFALKMPPGYTLNI